MKKVVIIDDEVRNRKTLEVLLNHNFPDLHICGHADNVKTGLELIEREKPQIVFLDIQMPDGSGFDLLRRLNNYEFEVIFTTAFDEYALEAFHFAAIGYLLKPISAAELTKVVKRAVELVDARHDNREDQILALIEKYSKPTSQMHRLVLPDTGGFQVLSIENIIYLEGERNYTKIILTSGEKQLSSYNLGIYEKYLLSEGFFRISRSHLINMAFVMRVTKVNGKLVVMMKNGDNLPISHMKKDEMRNFFS
jgi:two-component system LytT family response regulator